MGPQGRCWGEQMVKREARFSVRDCFVTFKGRYTMNNF